MMLSKEQIAELTTRIVEAVAGNCKENISWMVADLCALYEQMYDTIKKKDQET